jgi:hypothetical protein
MPSRPDGQKGCCGSQFGCWPAHGQVSELVVSMCAALDRDGGSVWVGAQVYLCRCAESPCIGYVG